VLLPPRVELKNMHIEHLVKMANQIGEFFEAMPDRPEALEGIATHIHKFWAPRMRLQLADHIASQAGEGLLPIVKQALTDHASVLTVLP
jgi:formate dehydrogenase subunit delta